MTHGPRRWYSRGPKTRAYIELLADDSKLVRGLQDAQRKLKGWGDGIKALGSTLMTTGIAAATPFALAAREFATFESSMARVKALTAASEQDFAALTEEARKLGRDTVFTAGQAADAMSFFALAGFKVDEILKATNPTLALAAAGQIEIAQAADISAKIMRSMGIEADSLGGVVDVMAKAMSTANTDMLQLGDAFKFVGPAARAAGFSLEEITAAIQMLSDAGIQGEMAGTTLRGMILTLSDPGKAPMLAQLGVRVRDLQGNFRRLADIVDDFQTALSKRGTFDVASALGGIFENRQVTGAMTLVAEGAEKLRTRITALEQSAGTGAHIAAVQLDTLMGSWKIFLSALQDVAIELGASLSPTLREWATGLVDAFNAVSRLIKQNREWFVGLAKGTLIVIGLGAALVGLGLTLKLVGLAVGGLTIGFLAVVSVIKLVASSIAFVLTPLGLVLKTIDAMGTAFAISRQGRASFAAWGEAFGAMAEDAKTAWHGIIDAVMSDDLELAARIGLAGVKSAWVEAVAALKITWANFASWWQQRVETARSNFALLLREPVPNMQEGLAHAIAGAGEFLGVLPEGAAANVRQMHRERVRGDPVRQNIIDDHQAQMRAIEQEEAARIAAIQREGNEARAQLQALVQQAAAKRAQAAVQAAIDAQRRVPGAFGGVGGGSAPRAFGMPVIDMGTFSAHVARLVSGTTDVERQQLVEQRGINDHVQEVERIVKKLPAALQDLLGLLRIQ